MSAVFTAGAEPFFALKYQRLLFRSGDMTEMGATAYSLCSFVASIQDERRFQSPCTFFNGFLMEMIGVSKVHTLIAARKKAVDLGWLGYESKKKSREAGQYWVCVPDKCLLPKNGSSDGSSMGTSIGSSDGTSDGSSNGTREGIRSGIPITIDPMPNPDPEKKENRKKKSPPKKSDRPEIIIDQLDFPPELDSHACRSAMDQYVNHRIAIKEPFPTVNAANMLLKIWGNHGAERFIAACENTVASGKWIKLVEPDSNGNNGTQRKPASRLLTDEEEADMIRAGGPDAYVRKMGWA